MCIANKHCHVASVQHTLSLNVFLSLVGDAGLRHNLAMTLHLFTSWLVSSHVAAWKVSRFVGLVSLFLILVHSVFFPFVSGTMQFFVLFTVSPRTVSIVLVLISMFVIIAYSCCPFCFRYEAVVTLICILPILASRDRLRTAFLRRGSWPLVRGIIVLWVNAALSVKFPTGTFHVSPVCPSRWCSLLPICNVIQSRSSGQAGLPRQLQRQEKWNCIIERLLFYSYYFSNTSMPSWKVRFLNQLVVHSLGLLCFGFCIGWVFFHPSHGRVPSFFHSCKVIFSSGVRAIAHL